MLAMEEYTAFLGAVRSSTGLDMLVPDEDGLVSVRGDAELIAKTMNDNAATGFDFLVTCEKA